ncbi:MAG TPA: hypothetical protein VNV82_17620 [Bryobacteraceae bacterium]|jgi:hypothetical protein|nr:hypothetical protein [Bryobacteraceae bacterium]
MRSFPIFAIAGLLAVGASAQPQYYPGPPPVDRYSDRGSYYGRYERTPGDLFNRLRSDIERAEANSNWNGGDRRRFNKVREELSEFQRSGNRHELNDTISALQHVVNSNRLLYGDREVLARDLYELQDFRVRNGWR